MSLFGAIIKTAVNVVTLPVDVALDVLTFLPDATGENRNAPGSRVKDKIETIKEDADA